MAENQAKMKQIPAFTVLKNGSILKNIFLLHKSSIQDSDEQVLLVGRHPNCNITLEHPSISRHHLRIHSNPSSHSLYVLDLSSVHGTWVSGNKIEPGVIVRLKEGDTVKLGGSSRVYVLHWVPASEAYDCDGQFVPAIYTIKEGEDETNQDEKLETRSWDDDLECSDISLSSKSHHSPVTKLNQLTFSGQNYLNSVCDDSEVQQLSTSGTGNQNGETLGTVSVKSPSVVSATKSVIDQLDWLNDNLSIEFEMLSYGSSKDDLFWAPSCSKSSCDDTEAEQLSLSRTGNENGETFVTVSVKSPSVVSGTKSVIDQLDWLNDNLSNEYELLSYGTNKDDMLSAPCCSKSSCADPEMEYSSNQNDDIFAKISVQSPLVVPESIPAREISSNLKKSEDQLNWLKDDLNNEFKLQNHGIIKEDVFSVADCSSSSCDDTKVEQLSPSKTGNGNGGLFSTMLVQPSLVSEAISAAKISDSLKKSEDQGNWLRDNLSNEFVLQNHGIAKDMFSVQSCLNSSCDDTEVGVSEISASLNRSKDEMNWPRDNLSNEFVLNNHVSGVEDSFSGPNGTKSSCDVTELEPSSPWETCNENGNVFTAAANQAPLVSESISVTETSDSLNESEDQLNWLRDNLSNETFATVSIQAPLVGSEAISETEISVSLYKSEDWLRDNLSNDFEQLSYDTMKDARVSSKKHEKDSSNQDIARSIESDMCNEYENVNQQKIDNGSVPVDLLDGLNRDGDESFQPDRAGGEEVDMGCEFEKINQANMTDVSATVVLIDGVESKVDDMCVKSESIGHEIMKKESVLVVPPAETCTDQKQAFTPDTARAKEVPMNLEALKNGSVLMNLLDSLDGNEFEIFTPDKENKDPKAYSVKYSKKRWMEDEHKISSHNTISKTAVRTPTVDEEKYIFSFSAETKNVFVQRSLNDKDLVDPLVYYDKALLSTSEKETESRQGKMEGSFNSINFPQTVQKAVDSSHNFLRGAKEKWTMIVDTGSLLNAESLKYLTLLKGLKGTRLVIPKAVMRELMDIEIQDTFLKTSTKKATSALKWIEACMVSTRWWIHMDDKILLSSEAESQVLETALLLRKEITDQKVIILSNDLNVKIQDTFLKASTKKATSALKWVEECMVSTRWWIHMDDEILLSSEAASRVLETALLLRKETTDQKIIILSNDLNVKIKAMAEGVMCEAAKEFHRSLVNPFSERFMWAGSVARGLTWSCIDDDILRQKYYGCRLDGPHMLKGLKLLAHVTTFQ